MKNTPEEISEVRVRALEALIRCEGHLEHRMYECADFYAHNKDSQDVKIYIHCGLDGKRNSPEPRMNKLTDYRL